MKILTVIFLSIAIFVLVNCTSGTAEVAKTNEIKASEIKQISVKDAEKITKNGDVQFIDV